ncbi:MAG: hypothetical protein AAFU72_05715 [Pseudomonadota bacterium]
MRHPIAVTALAGALAAAVAPAQASVITISSTSFTETTTFNDVTTYSFEIELADALVAGQSYVNPALAGIDYSVNGTLPDGSPSGFPGFNLVRSISSGAEFYGQGSSLSFMIAAGADLSDGLQLSEIDGTFTLDAREMDTGRFHPPVLTLESDGTGLLQNSRNLGGINPSSLTVVDVQPGEEYITELSSDPATVTLADVDDLAAVVPLPPTLLLLGGALAVPLLVRRHA